MTDALSLCRVLDLTTEIGQFAGRCFAELGAEVIKIEPPEGDAVRRIGPFFHDQTSPDRSLLWGVLNASKKGITLRLADLQGRDLFEKLLAKTDLVIESYPPGYLKRLGIDHDLLSKHPKLVWVSVTGFGQSGPYKGFKWSDAIGQALGGLLYLWGEPERAPVRPRAAQGYYHASMAAAMSGMAALYHARRTGRGQYIDVSMQEVLTFILAGAGGVSGYWQLEGINITRSGSGINLGKLVSRSIYPCKGGYVAVGTLFGPHFPTVLDLMSADGMGGFLADDPKWRSATRFAPLPGQWQCEQADADAAEDLFAAWLKRYTRDQIMKMAKDNELMIFPVLNVPDNLTSEQLKSRGYWQHVDHPELGTSITYPGPPAKLSATPWRIRGRAPLLGEHNGEVYGGLGLSSDAQNKLRAAGVI